MLRRERSGTEEVAEELMRGWFPFQKEKNTLCFTERLENNKVGPVGESLPKPPADSDGIKRHPC
jgi:hypothetical protein